MFVPYEKLSKKAQKKVNSQKRKLWNTKPITKVVESKKKYKRKGLDFSEQLWYNMLER